MRNQQEKRALWVRIICGILVLLMLVSAGYAAIMAIIIDVSANTDIAEYAIKGDTHAGIYVSVGVVYGDEAETAPTAETGVGFIIGENYVDKWTRTFTPYLLFEGVTSVGASPLTFLTMSGGRYVPTNAANASVLPYRVELSAPTSDVWELQARIEQLVPNAKNLFTVKGLKNGQKVLKYGAYADASSASSMAGEFQALLSSLPAVSVNISIPSGSGICLYNTANGEILFEFDSDSPDRMPAIRAIKDSSGISQTYLPSSDNQYYDAIGFSRYDDKINTLNLVELNTYVEGVLPSEIYTSWPAEVQKAFAIIVRSLTVGFLCGKHYKYYNIDVCDTACCQAYRGRSRITDASNAAVQSTGYQVMTINGGIAHAYYTAVNGGESILMNHAWGGTSLPHIVSQKTPWEQYTTYIKDRGYWFYEFTPSELTSQLRKKGYTNVKKPIVSAEINERAGETNYVYTTTYTDTAGNVQIINRTSKNYGALGVKSANYDIAIGSIGYFLDTVLSTEVKRISAGQANPLITVFNVATENGIFTHRGDGANVLTDSGLLTLPKDALNILTENGNVILNQASVSTPPPSENGEYTAINVYEDTMITTKLRREYLTKTASSAGNFIIAGKGWGHGIGLSQYGANDLAKAGAEYDQIIKAYFKDTVIMTIRQLRGLE